MNFSLLNYGFKTLLIASLFGSCSQQESTTIAVYDTINKNLLPIEWQEAENINVQFSRLIHDSKEQILLEAVEPGNVMYSQTFALDSGEYFLMAKYDASIEEGSFYIRAGSDKSIFIDSISKICERTLFSISMMKSGELEIQFGLEPGSRGSVLLESLSIIPIFYNYLNDDLANSIANEIWDKLGIALQQDSTLSRNVDLLAASVNMAFLSKNEFAVATFKDQIFSQIGTQYLSKFINDPNIKDAYCQKSSLSLDELIRSFNIPTRQLHWQKDCTGFHQFLEYWNAYDNRWEIIDPYYGIRYIDEQGNYLDFESIEKLVRINNFTKGNIKKIDIGHLLYSEEEIIYGWKEGGLAIHVKE